MMELGSTHVLFALLVSNGAALFGATLALLRVERIIKESNDSSDDIPVRTALPVGPSIRSQAKSFAVLSGLIDRRLEKMQSQIQKVVEKKAPAAAERPAQMPIEYAVRLARQGASIEDISRTCGLNKAEAKLTYQLHARKTPQSNAHDRLMPG